MKFDVIVLSTVFDLESVPVSYEDERGGRSSVADI